MGKGKGHVPIRTCISCGTKRPKSDLIRLVLDPDGWVVCDFIGNAPGRGAYVCRREECWAILRDSNRLKKAFRGKGKYVMHCSVSFPKQF